MVGLLLRIKIQAIREEVEALTALLERDQDPRGMGELQELIGVRCLSLIASWTISDHLSARRTCWRR